METVNDRANIAMNNYQEVGNWLTESAIKFDLKRHQLIIQCCHIKRYYDVSIASMKNSNSAYVFGIMQKNEHGSIPPSCTRKIANIYVKKLQVYNIVYGPQ